MARPTRTLFVVTSTATMGESGDTTGLWFEEFTAPYTARADAGHAIEVVSTAGDVAPIDPRSVTEEAFEIPENRRHGRACCMRPVRCGRCGSPTTTRSSCPAVTAPCGTCRTASCSQMESVKCSRRDGRWPRSVTAGRAPRAKALGRPPGGRRPMRRRVHDGGGDRRRPQGKGPLPPRRKACPAWRASGEGRALLCRWRRRAAISSPVGTRDPRAMLPH